LRFHAAATAALYLASHDAIVGNSDCQSHDVSFPVADGVRDELRDYREQVVELDGGELVSESLADQVPSILRRLLRDWQLNCEPHPSLVSTTDA
jgi:hypothetical protein